MRKEIPICYEKPEIKTPRFVLLLGPSGVGKSTIIRDLYQKDDRIQFVSPIIDRPNRPGETEKVSISKEAFTELAANNFFLVVNNIYGNRYGTPSSSVDEMLCDGRIPILDFPLKSVKKLEKYRDILYNVYIVPPTLGTLHTRVDKDQRGVDNDRYIEGREELLELVKNHFQHPDIHDVVINKDTSQSSPQLLNLIYKAIS